MKFKLSAFSFQLSVIQVRKRVLHFLTPESWHLKATQKGFTLIELLVVTAIIVIVTSLVLINNNRFGGAVLLQNLAYDMALSVREAQVYGISVLSFGGEFDFGYGMHFDTNSQTYILFADALVQNGLYDCPNPGLQGFVRTRRVDGHAAQLPRRKIVRSAASSMDACLSNPDLWVSKLDILFKRPEPDACISANDSIKLDSDGACTLNRGKRAHCRRVSRAATREASSLMRRGRYRWNEIWTGSNTSSQDYFRRNVLVPT